MRQLLADLQAVLTCTTLALATVVLFQIATR